MVLFSNTPVQRPRPRFSPHWSARPEAKREQSRGAPRTCARPIRARQSPRSSWRILRNCNDARTAEAEAGCGAAFAVDQGGTLGGFRLGNCMGIAGAMDAEAGQPVANFSVADFWRRI